MGNVHDKDLESDEKCPFCYTPKVYSIEYDAYYCSKCNKWLESKCEDKECKFCSKRPDKPLSKKADPEESDIRRSAVNLLSDDVNKRRRAAIKLREYAENGVDISYALTSLLALLSKKDSEDILYDYVYTDPDEMTDYKEYLDVYESYLAIKSFVKLSKRHYELLLKLIEENKINKNVWWVKGLIGSK